MQISFGGITTTVVLGKSKKAKCEEKQTAIVISKETESILAHR